eukprot:TRINITY_DN12992_c0_g1_i5.p1 TRINITY_DN12992_c0_g1~~TRINITY_DN12992_c0_g1_i5.p1  ORF type:complete len:210 (+),score=24.40 TRINITY_DN12992_c0_g1_i5:173-802(+)
MATFAPALAADLLASRKSDVRNSEALLRTTLHASANVGNSFANMIQLLATVLILLAHLAALLAPSVFFLSLIYLGGVHGSDKCSKDLDGLLVWYGGVGMASLVLNCMEGGAAGRFVNVAVWSARLMLLVLPWIGAWWSISLIVDEWPVDNDWPFCGRYMMRLSLWLWTSLTTLQLVFVALVGGRMCLLHRQERDMRWRLSPDRPRDPVV